MISQFCVMSIKFYGCKTLSSWVSLRLIESLDSIQHNMTKTGREQKNEEKLLVVFNSRLPFKEFYITENNRFTILKQRIKNKKYYLVNSYQLISF